MSSYSSHSDEELVSLSLAGKDSFAELIVRYQDKLTRYIRRISNCSSQDIEDILQEVFIKVYQNLNNFDPSLKFSSWIYRITHNEVISWFRKHNVRPQGHAVEASEEVFERLVSDTDIAADLDTKYLRDHLVSALSKIDQKYREVLVLQYFEDKSYQEISDILKRPMGTVATLVSRAKRKLKEQLNHVE